LRQIIEDEGLSERVLGWSPITMGLLIEVYERSDRTCEELKWLLTTAAGIMPEILTKPDAVSIRRRCDEDLTEVTAPFKTLIDDLQGIANKHFEGAKLDAAILRRMSAKLCLNHPAVKAIGANKLPLPVAIVLLEWSEAVEAPGRAGGVGSNRSDGPTNDDGFISHEEAKWLTGLSGSQLSKLCGRGEIRRDRPGRGCRLRLSDVRKYAKTDDDREPKTQSELAGIEARKREERAKKLPNPGKNRR
jgi:hypothetical protein